MRYFRTRELSIEEWPSMSHQILLFLKLGFLGWNALWPIRSCSTSEYEGDSLDFRRFQKFKDQTSPKHRRSSIGILGRFESCEEKDWFGEVDRKDCRPPIA